MKYNKQIRFGPKGKGKYYTQPHKSVKHNETYLKNKLKKEIYDGIEDFEINNINSNLKINNYFKHLNNLEEKINKIVKKEKK